jgi:hypothetical protein
LFVELPPRRPFAPLRVTNDDVILSEAKDLSFACGA